MKSELTLLHRRISNELELRANLIEKLETTTNAKVAADIMTDLDSVSDRLEVIESKLKELLNLITNEISKLH